MRRRMGLLLAMMLAGAAPARAQGEAMGDMDMSLDQSNPHMTVTPAWPERPGDRERADSIVRVVRAAVARYADVSQAEADGFRRFAPQVKQQRLYHYTSAAAALRARFGFDAARPTALLYRDDGHGGLVLHGVMYTMPAGATLGELDHRIPLSIARWHQHTNICLPPRARAQSVRFTPGGAFGPAGRIATREACEAAGGRFSPRMFGWMVHVNLEAGDPAGAWDDSHGGMRQH